jgi:hypothetical protein
MYINKEANKNLFQIWQENGNKVPFMARRFNWTNEYTVIVEETEIIKMPYGIARGYAMKNGQRTNHFAYGTQWNRDQRIPNAGSYQWILVQD